jgi:peptidoglycan/LPS O-acetylase OafA/YrhL
MRVSEVDNSLAREGVIVTRDFSGCLAPPASEPGSKALPLEAHSSIVALDLARGLAALLVVLVHVRQTAFVDYTALPPDTRGVLTALFYGLTRSGNEAVLVFFVLSGLLVGGQVVSRVMNGCFDWAIYALDRASRIFLPLIPAVIISAAIGIFVLGHSPGLLEIFANTFGLNGVITETMIENRPLWSLAYEIWFYVIGGALAYIFSRGPNLWSVGLLSAGTFSMAVLDTRYFLFWGLGAVASLFGVLRKCEMLFVIGLLLVGAGAFLNQLTVPTKIFENPPVPTGIDGASLLCIGLCLMTPLLCSEGAARNLKPLRRPAAALASFSYSLYLFHFPINEVLQIWMPQASDISIMTSAQFLLRVVLCIVGSLFFYWCFERNTGAVRHTLSRHLQLGARAA